MKQNNNTSTANSNSNDTTYIMKLADLLNEPSGYQDGEEVLEKIKKQLDSLINIKDNPDTPNTQKAEYKTTYVGTSFTVGGLRI